MGNSNNKRSGRLAISPNINAGTNKKAKALQENKNTNHIRGVDGYSAKAIKLGIYEDIAYSIQMYREYTNVQGEKSRQYIYICL